MSKRKPKKKRRPQTAEEFAPYLRRIGGKALALGVIRESDVDRYAQRLAAAKTDVARGDVMNEWFEEMAGRLEESRSRTMQKLAAQHPQPN